MAATTATITGLMKEVYEARIQEQYNMEKVALRRVESSSEGVTSRVGGKYVDFPIVVSRGAGHGYRDENEALMDPGQAEFDEVHIALFYGYRRGHITGQAIRLAKGNPQAFASAFDQEMDIAKEAVVKDSNRIAYRDGMGSLGVVTALPTGNVVPVDNTQFFWVGQRVTSHNPTTYAQTNTGGTDNGPPGNTYKVMTVTNVNFANDGTPEGTVTFDDAAGVAAGNVLIIPGNVDPGGGVPRGKEPYGFEAITSDTLPLFGLDPAVQSIWKGNQVDQAGALSEMTMIAAMDTARRQGGKPTVVFCSLGVRRAYFASLVEDRQFHNTQTFQGGFEGLPFSYGRTIPVVEDPDAPPGKMFFMEEPKLKEYREEAWHFADEDGNTLKYVIGYDKWEYLLRQYWNIGTSQRNAHVELYNITEVQ